MQSLGFTKAEVEQAGWEAIEQDETCILFQAHVLSNGVINVVLMSAHGEDRDQFTMFLLSVGVVTGLGQAGVRSLRVQNELLVPDLALFNLNAFGTFYPVF